MAQQPIYAPRIPLPEHPGSILSRGMGDLGNTLNQQAARREGIAAQDARAARNITENRKLAMRVVSTEKPPTQGERLKLAKEQELERQKAEFTAWVKGEGVEKLNAMDSKEVVTKVGHDLPGNQVGLEWATKIRYEPSYMYKHKRGITDDKLPPIMSKESLTVIQNKIDGIEAEMGELVRSKQDKSWDMMGRSQPSLKYQKLRSDLDRQKAALLKGQITKVRSTKESRADLLNIPAGKAATGRAVEQLRKQGIKKGGEVSAEAISKVLGRVGLALDPESVRQYNRTKTPQNLTPDDIEGLNAILENY